MDIDLNILGPYAAQLQKAREQKKTRTESVSQEKGAYRRSNFTALYKKPNLKFNQDPDARREGRMQTMEERRRTRRSQAFNEARKPAISELTNQINEFIHEDSSNEISGLSSTDASSLLSVSQQKEITNNAGNNSNVSVAESGIYIDDRNNSNISSKFVETTAKADFDFNHVVSSSRNVVNNINKNGSKKDQNRKPSPPMPSKPITDSRRDHLQKWKKEKEAANLKAKRVQKPAFKVPAPVPPPAKPAKITSSTSLVKSVNSTTSGGSTLLSGSKNSSHLSVNKPTANVSGIASARQPIGSMSSRVAPTRQVATAVSKTTTRPTTAPLAPAANKQEDVRRVTRAMTKTQTVGVTKPITQKMKALNINEKATSSKLGIGGGNPKVPNPPVAATGAGKSARPTGRTAITTTASGVSKANAAVSASLPAPSKVNAKKVTGKPAAKPAASSTTLTSQQSPSPPLSQQQEQAPPLEQVAVVKKKKAKPKAIDGTYTDYNGRFSDACRKLGGLSTEWRTILEEQKKTFSEEVQDEIYSALGKVKLLLESKLPQFGELLYSYLLKDEDTTIILACDLEGWWDVAYIQVEAVYKIFESLTALKNNNWQKPEPSPPPQPKSKRRGSEGGDTGSDDKSSFVPPQRRAVSKPKVGASGGLKAFLAKQRQKLPTKSDSDIIINAPESQARRVSDKAMDISFASNVAEPPTPRLRPRPTNEVKSNTDLKLNLNQLNSELTLPESDRKFEGGFFTISSPAGTPTTPRERRINQNTSFGVESIKTPASAVPAALRTPNRVHRLSGVSSTSGASLRRQSLSMLGVRRSMGTFSRIGAVSVFAEDRNEEMEED